MCKQPAHYYCARCSLYVSSASERLKGSAPDPHCPSCDGPLTTAEPPPLNLRLWCPNCNLSMDAADAIPAEGERSPTCSCCGTELLRDLHRVQNPIQVGLALKLIGVVARLLDASGALDALDKYAYKTDTELDDLAARIARAIIKECTKL
ncbi:hypothetical protein ES705_29080 [subsurface metagenome]